MSFYTFLVYARRNPLFGRLAYLTLKILGAEIPLSVQIGGDFLLQHGGYGVVIHPHTRVGDRVRVYPGVTLGRADIHLPAEESDFEGIVVEDDVILAAGAKVLGQGGVLRIGRGTIVGANAVLFESTGENEVWAGIPARRVGMRGQLKAENAKSAEKKAKSRRSLRSSWPDGQDRRR